jgi:hypothetical protein
VTAHLNFWSALILFLPSVGLQIFCLQADGPDWIAFSGELHMNENIKVGGFNAGGFTVKVVPPPPNMGTN